MKLEMSMILIGAGLFVAAWPLALLINPWFFIFMVPSGILTIFSGWLRDDTT